MNRSTSCTALVLLLAAIGAAPLVGPVRAQNAPDLDCVFKGTCKPQQQQPPPVDRERLERERQERERRQALERERQERERAERERQEREKVDRDRQERERVERERQDRDRQERERVERERQDRDRLDRDRQERERVERERQERERAERDRLERERVEREKAERDRLKGLPKDQTPPAIAERLVELRRGDANDVLLFFNETADAPNGRRAPGGGLTFRDSQFAPCAALGWSGGPEVSAAVLAVLERHGASRMVGDVATPCPEGRRPFDIVAVERRLLQTSPPASVHPLVADIVERRLTPLAVVSASDIAAARDRLQRGRDVAAGLRDGSLKGMGLLILGGTARRICAAGVEEEQKPAVAAAIQGWRGQLPQNLVVGGPDIATFDRDGALAAARRGECGAIFGDAAMLRDIDAALRAEGRPSSPAQAWLTPPEWEALLERAGVPRNLAERRRQLAGKVNPLAERLVADLQAYIAADGKSGPIGAEFPAFAQWHGQLKTMKWALSVQNFTIDDYGDATWTGGTLPSVAVVVNFGLTSPGVQGARANCMIFAWLDDASSGARRETTAFGCDAVSEIERWKRQRAMKSKWS